MINPRTLSERRTLLGLSQRKLALLVGLNFQVIRRLEAGGDDGNLMLRDLARVCDVLSVSPLVLLAPVEPPKSIGAGSVAELNLAQARLLRVIQKGADVRRVLTSEERELVLPFLIKIGLVDLGEKATLDLSEAAKHDLMIPEPS